MKQAKYWIINRGPKEKGARAAGAGREPQIATRVTPAFMGGYGHRTTRPSGATHVIVIIIVVVVVIVIVIVIVVVLYRKINEKGN